MKMTKARKIALGLSLAATMLAGGAYAAEKGAAASGKDDGVITRAEAETHARELFQRLDANHDGKLDQADAEARRVERRNAVFDRMDADHNGQISRAEFDAAGPRGPGGPEGPGRFRGADGGPDGGHGFHRWGGGHRGWGHGPEHGSFAGPGGAPGANGPVTEAQFVAAAMQRFDKADANHDGKVTREERHAAREAMRTEMRARWQQQGAPAPGGLPPQPPAN